MKKGWTNVDPAAVSEPEGAFRSAAMKAALLALSLPPGGTVVVEGVDDELQAASNVPAATRLAMSRWVALRRGPVEGRGVMIESTGAGTSVSAFCGRRSDRKQKRCKKHPACDRTYRR